MHDVWKYLSIFLGGLLKVDSDCIHTDFLTYVTKYSSFVHSFFYNENPRGSCWYYSLVSSWGKTKNQTITLDVTQDALDSPLPTVKHLTHFMLYNTHL